MKVKKLLIVIATVVIIMGAMVTTSDAAIFNLDVSFNGNTMTMTSEEENIGLNALNLLPGQEDLSHIVISNVGSQKVTIYMNATVVNDEDLLEILEISITDSKGKELYTGNYADFKKVEISLEKGEKETYAIKTSLPIEAGNEYQDKELNVKFSFEANGEEIKVEIENPKTNQSKIIIYGILLAIVLILVIILIRLTVNKKSKK